MNVHSANADFTVKEETTKTTVETNGDEVSHLGELSLKRLCFLVCGVKCVKVEAAFSRVFSHDSIRVYCELELLL